ncbi:hypothetical protein SAMN05421803_11513 [Nocardiopsis flavescens]|uniref:Uncharacterized protein n=1 Tax=Nocardiopsis flavescens TaxID=758803 RepID=A0A1M6QDE8_9ACTN|nr:hypothetical protein SAMN05421803_11513 [Nocardiopsis flavescens]
MGEVRTPVRGEGPPAPAPGGGAALPRPAASATAARLRLSLLRSAAQRLSGAPNPPGTAHRCETTRNK